MQEIFQWFDCISTWKGIQVLFIMELSLSKVIPKNVYAYLSSMIFSKLSFYFGTEYLVTIAKESFLSNNILLG